MRPSRNPSQRILDLEMEVRRLQTTNERLEAEVARLRAELDEPPLLQEPPADAPPLAEVLAEARAVIGDETLDAAFAELDAESGQYARLTAQAALLTAPGPSRFFSYDANHRAEFHDTAEAAKQFAEEMINSYREDATFDGEWSDEVEDICWGVVLERATSERVETEPDDDTDDTDDTDSYDYHLSPTGGAE